MLAQGAARCLGTKPQVRQQQNTQTQSLARVLLSGGRWGAIGHVFLDRRTAGFTLL